MTAVVFISLAETVKAQFGPRGPRFNSPESGEDGKVYFRVHAPNAKEVKLSSSDIPGVGRGLDMVKND